MTLHRIDELLKRRPKGVLVVLALGLLLLIAVIDYSTGPDLSFSIFYLVPIALLAWYATASLGLLMCVLATATWFFSDFQSHPDAIAVLVHGWNALVRLTFFLIVSSLLAKMNRKLRAEEASADTDALTGALNSRGFYERVEAEMNRARRYRHKIVLAYLDLDNFKIVNDTHGHTVGDTLLQTIVRIIQENTRANDLVARLGGDEFAVLFVETAQDAGEQVAEKLRLAIRDAMTHSGWPVSASVGVVSYTEIPENVHEVVRLADDLMYHVKRSGKDRLEHRTWPPQAAVEKVT